MKRNLLVFLVAILAGAALPPAGSSEEGEIGVQLFQERGCGACHDRTMDQTIYRLGPSLNQIAEAYKGHEADLDL